MSVNCGRRLSGRSKRFAPGLSDGMRCALDVSQVAVSVMVTARWPAWSEFSQKRAWPLAMSAAPAVQPEGSSAIQGSSADEGTACADRILVLGQLPHGMERVLIFHGAIQDRAPQLVPAVCADMAKGVELGEQVLVRVAFDGHAQRR